MAANDALLGSIRTIMLVLTLPSVPLVRLVSEPHDN